MKARRLIAYSLLYVLIAFVAIGVAMLAVGDCIQGQATIGRCNHLAMERRHYGALAAIAAYPIFIAWILLRARKRG